MAVNSPQMHCESEGDRRGWSWLCCIVPSYNIDLWGCSHFHSMKLEVRNLFCKRSNTKWLEFPISERRCLLTNIPIQTNRAWERQQFVWSSREQICRSGVLTACRMCLREHWQ